MKVLIELSKLIIVPHCDKLGDKYLQISMILNVQV